MIVSSFEKSPQGKWYLKVEGKPFLYNSVEAYLKNKRMLPKIFSCCTKAGYSILSLWLSWREVEFEEGNYDFASLQKIIDLAKEYDLRVEIVWGGTNFCDKLDVRLVPDWILLNKTYLLHDKSKNPIYVSGNDMGMCNVANAKSKKLLAIEKKVLLSIIEYLKNNDTTHRVVLVRLANDINNNGYASGKSDTIKYINSLAKAVNSADYKIATTITISNWYQDEFDKDIDALQCINAQGISTFVPNVSFTRKIFKDGNATKFKYVSANAAYENSTSHIVTALCNGGFYCIYRLNDDVLWDRPGIYDEQYNIKPIAVKLNDFNLSMRKISKLIAKAPAENMLGFNTEYDGMPDMYYRGLKTINGLNVGYITRCNGSVGLMVFDENCFYCITDSLGTFFFEKQMVCEVGYFDENDRWVTTEKREAMLYDTMFYYNCNCRECLKMYSTDIELL